MQRPRRLKVGLLWHSVNSANLGVGALIVSRIEIARAAAARAGVEVCFLVLGWKDQRPASASGPDVEAAGFRQRDLVRPAAFQGEIHEASDVALALPYRTPQPRTPEGPIRIALNISGLLFKGGYDRANMFGLKADYARTMRRSQTLCQTRAGSTGGRLPVAV